MKTLETRHGIFTIDELHDKWIYKNLTQRDGYQFKDIDLVLPFVTGNVIDVGAHIGLFSVPISKAAKQVWSIEGNKNNFDLLQKNLEANGCANVHTLNIVASSVVGSYHMVQQPNNSETQFTQKGDGDAVDGKPLDSLTQERIDFIKMDAEGMEPQVLRGATRIIEEDRPYIFLEVNKKTLRDQGSSAGEISKLLKGYRFYRVDDGFNRVFSLSQGALSDILAVPKGRHTPRARGALSYLLHQLVRRIKWTLSH